MIAFEEYAKIKNNYCLCYFGQCDEYLIMLEVLRPKIEQAFPGMDFYIGCRDESVNVLSTKDKVLSISELRLKKNTFAHIKELKYEEGCHPIEQILYSCDIENLTVRSEPIQDLTTKATIVTHNTYPTDPMKEKHIEIARRVAQSRGFEVEISNDWENAGLVIGVESIPFMRAGIAGIPIMLVDTGIGKSLYQNMFPYMELLPI